MRAGIEDEMHHYHVTIGHDGALVAAIDAVDVRVPWATCSGSLAQLDALVGTPLTRSIPEVLARTDPSAHCTHLLDLTALAIAHASSRRPDRQLDAEVPDWTAPPFTARLLVDGEVALDWTLDATYTITDGFPDGVSVKGGFTRWCATHLDPDTAEAATVLQRAVWMAPARQLDLESFPDVAASGIGMGVCWSTQPGQVEVAVRNRGTLRDYGPSSDGMLDGF